MYITPQDIYFGGYDGANAVYWKNGVETTLPKSPSSFYAVAYAMFISGTDVYFAGNDGDNLVYWKNGVEVVLQGNSSKGDMVNTIVSTNE